MNDDCFVTAAALGYGIDGGLRFKNFFIQPSEPENLYSLKGKIDAATLWTDGQGRLAWREGWDEKLHPTTSEEWECRRTAWKEDIRRFEEDKKQYIRYFKPKIEIDDIHGRTRLADYEEPQNLRTSSVAGKNCQVYYRKHWLDKWESVGTYEKVFPQAYGIRVVKRWDGKYLIRSSLFKPLETPEREYEYAELLDDGLLYFTENGIGYWVYLENKVCFTVRPDFVAIGFMDFIKVGSVYMERSPYSMKTYRRAEIRMCGDVCFLGNNEVVVKSECGERRFCIRQRHLDGKRFVLGAAPGSGGCGIYDMYYDGKKPPVIKRRKRNNI